MAASFIFIHTYLEVCTDTKAWEKTGERVFYLSFKFFMLLSITALA